MRDKPVNTRLESFTLAHIFASTSKPRSKSTSLDVKPFVDQVLSPDRELLLNRDPLSSRDVGPDLHLVSDIFLEGLARERVLFRHKRDRVLELGNDLGIAVNRIQFRKQLVDDRLGQVGRPDE